MINPGSFRATIKSWDYMKKAQAKSYQILLVALILLVTIISLLGIQGCQSQQATNETLQKTQTNNLVTPTSRDTEVKVDATATALMMTSTPADEFQPVWGDYLPPSIDPATPIPPPQPELSMPDEVLVWVLLGSDTEPLFIGRTQAIHLVFVHPRFSKASLVSIPGDLYVYIPGYTMQRISSAYALGGIETLKQTFAYNFGVTPSRFVLAHPGDLQWLVDDINGIEVTVFSPIPQACGGIRAGLVEMDGAMALCYGTYRDGMDEMDRMRRQQQLLRDIFRKLTRNGNLVRLPMIYASFEDWVKTDLSLGELMGHIPLALRLADSNRIGYYMIGWDQVTLWQLPGRTETQVFLPREKDVKILLEEAIERILVPEPLSNQVRTLEAQLTAAYQATATPGAFEFPMPTPSPSTTPITSTPSPSQTPVPTSTQQGYP